MPCNLLNPIPSLQELTTSFAARFCQDTRSSSSSQYYLSILPLWLMMVDLDYLVPVTYSNQAQSLASARTCTHAHTSAPGPGGRGDHANAHAQCACWTCMHRSACAAWQTYTCTHVYTHALTDVHIHKDPLVPVLVLHPFRP